MKIQSLKAVKIKGQSFDWKFAPINLITGDNFGGKTGMVDALTVACLGYHPALGKTNRATFRLASGAKMSTTLTREGMEPVERTWTSAKDAIKYSGYDGPICDIESLDATSFLTLSEKDRVKLVFAKAKIEDLTAESALQKIAGITSSDVSEDSSAATDAISRAVEASTKAFKGVSVQDGIQTAIVALKASKSESDAEKKRMEKTAQGLVDLRSQDETITANLSESDIAKEEKEISESLATKNNELGSLQSQAQQAVKMTGLRDSIQNQIESLQEAAIEFEAQEDNAGVLEKSTVENEEKLEAKMKTAEKSLAHNQKRLQAKQFELQTALESGKATKAQIEKLSKMETCPTCGQSCQGEAIESVKAILTGEVNLKRVLYATLKTEVAEIKEECDALEAEIETLENEIMSVTLGLEIKNNLSKLPNLREQLASITIPDSASEEKIETLKSEIAALRIRQSECVQKRQKIANVKAYAKSIAEAQDKAKEQEANSNAYKLAVAVLETIQSESMAKAFAPLLGLAKSFTDGIFKSPMEYREGDLGRWEDGTWITIDLFSGTEKAIAYAAICCGLAASGSKIAIVDELGRLTTGNKNQLLANVTKLVEQGKIDHFIGIDVDSKWAESNVIPDFVKHIKL